ncbi:unnamed protein product, partial [Mesorhabditis belari]|uniref:Glutathione-dependent dehydroascorbate reductase n=1 Tax=Mesorhabditis belari TaxID=2138241 RepID=A0AAF3EAQ3_9BILA
MTLKGLNTKALKAGDPEPTAAPAGTFRLYNMRFCPWAERALLYVARKGIDVEVVNIDLAAKPEWYFEKHYQGKVPTLEHNGKYVIESSLIPQYLDDILPEDSVLPKDPFERVKQKILSEKTLAISSAFYGLVAAFKDPSVKEEKLGNLKKALNDTEKLFENTYFGGAEPSFADYLTFPFVERVWWVSHIEGFTGFNVKNFPCEKDYPHLTKWFNAMVSRPEISKNIMPIEHALAFLESYKKGAANYDAGL